ncbi:L-2-hydroxyglutarate oxidase [bacterium]|nr:L-2-hydroxyglutarate oxidase [bacterium]
MIDDRADVVVVGAGVVGLAAARAITIDRPGTSVLVLEKEQRVATHQSGRNSGVVHAGVYYVPGSLKAELCRTGKTALERYVEERGIPIAHSGKVIIAVDDGEIPRLDELERRARANGVEGLLRIGAEGIKELEPAATGVAGLHSPRTAVVDFGDLAAALVEDVTGAGASVLTGRAVTSIEEGEDGAVVHTSAGDIHAGVVLACAGLHSDRLARVTHPELDARVVPFRGSYLRLRADKEHLVKGNVYPVPDPRYPFLGVHLTRRIDGEVWVGPNASLALGREAYKLSGASLRDLRDVMLYPGFWRFLAKNVQAAAREIPLTLSKRLMARAVRRYIPEVQASDLESGPAGIRAQVMRRDGSLVDDFLFLDGRRVIHVVNAPSPAATASLAIGDVLAAKVAERLDA